MDDQTIDTGMFLQLEQSLMRAATRASRTHLDSLLAPEFFEIGRSGKTYDKQDVIAALLALPAMESDTVPSLADFSAWAVAPDVVLVTYRMAPGQDHDGTLRSSLWIRDSGEWRMRFHQATPLASKP